jgi:hypothetical protein
MTLLELATEVGLDPKKVATTKGGEYSSSCPSPHIIHQPPYLKVYGVVYGDENGGIN